MDETLVDGPNSAFYRAYIAARPDVIHHIVTFRDRQWAGDIPFELAFHGLPRRAYCEIVDCPQDLFLSEDFKFWKGAAARALGCTILVDDKPTWVVPGCERHGIEFLFSHEKII